MIKLEQKHIKIFSVAIAVVFVGSVVALALTQMGGLTGGRCSSPSRKRNRNSSRSLLA